ncbi:hypothetical protein BGZ94_010300 [Podila epigama]|nr:hypothetical protein BGZ94_010300 [Podila epigama]
MLRQSSFRTDRQSDNSAAKVHGQYLSSPFRTTSEVEILSEEKNRCKQIEDAAVDILSQGRSDRKSVVAQQTMPVVYDSVFHKCLNSPSQRRAAHDYGDVLDDSALVTPPPTSLNEQQAHHDVNLHRVASQVNVGPQVSAPTSLEANEDERDPSWDDSNSFQTGQCDQKVSGLNDEPQHLPILQQAVDVSDNQEADHNAHLQSNGSNVKKYSRSQGMSSQHGIPHPNARDTAQNDNQQERFLATDTYVGTSRRYSVLLKMTSSPSQLDEAVRTRSDKVTDQRSTTSQPDNLPTNHDELESTTSIGSIGDRNGPEKQRVTSTLIMKRSHDVMDSDGIRMQKGALQRSGLTRSIHVRRQLENEGMRHSKGSSWKERSCVQVHLFHQDGMMKEGDGCFIEKVREANTLKTLDITSTSAQVSSDGMSDNELDELEPALVSQPSSRTKGQALALADPHFVMESVDIPEIVLPLTERCTLKPARGLHCSRENDTERPKTISEPRWSMSPSDEKEHGSRGNDFCAADHDVLRKERDFRKLQKHGSIELTSTDDPHHAKLIGLWAIHGFRWPLQKDRTKLFMGQPYSFDFVFGTAVPIVNVPTAMPEPH